MITLVNRSCNKLDMTALNRHRQDNAIRVAEELWRSPGISRAELARRLRLDRSTTGSLVDLLIDRGLVFERPSDTTDVAHPHGGRPPLLLSLHENLGFSIGVELSEGISRATATSLTGKLITESRFPIPEDPARLVETLVTELSPIITEASRSHTRLLTVSLGISGMVDSTGGSIIVSRDLHIKTPLALRDPLRDTFSVPVWLFNDADACALGELEYGPHRDGDLLFVLANLRIPDRRGINAGLGIVLDGNLRVAHSGAGREFRSPFVPPDSAEQFSVAVDFYAGRTSASDVPTLLADELGVSIAFLVHALDLRNIVLGGDLCTDEDRRALFEERIRHHISRDTVRLEGQSVLIREPTIEVRPVAFGASAGGIRSLFSHRLFPIDAVDRVFGSRDSQITTPAVGETPLASDGRE